MLWRLRSRWIEEFLSVLEAEDEEYGGKVRTDREAEERNAAVDDEKPNLN